ncbi:MAG: hypothetical protein SOY42_07895 [Clostridium sp.]|nr:hypothetical protein [Clostridium sp.]
MNYRDKWFDMCKHCNRSKQDELDDVVSDYAKNTVKNIKKFFGK